MVIAWLGLDLLVEFTRRFTPRAGEVEIDAAVLAFTLIVSVLTGFAFGTLPAIPSTKDLAAPLKDAGARSRAVGGPQSLRSTLIVAQVAVSFVLLIGAGLMVRSLFELQRVSSGIDPENVLALDVNLDWSKYTDTESRWGFFQPVLERINRLPGVLSASIVSTFPLNEQSPFSVQFDVEGEMVDDADLRPAADLRLVGPRFFETAGVPILKGRDFRASDDDDAPEVVIVNRSFAEHHWPDRDPIGQRLTGDRGESWSTVVGVVGDMRQRLEEEVRDEVYVPYSQTAGLTMSLLVRSVRNPLSLARQVKEAVYEVDSNQPVANIRTLEQVRSDYLASPRLTAILLGLFAGLALLITVTGIAGVIAFAVSQRTREIGIRMALGAESGSVLGMLLKQGMGLVLVGLVLGTVGAFGLSRLMSGLLFGVGPTDPITFVGVALLLAAVAALATFLPARAATGVDPVTALKTS